MIKCRPGFNVELPVDKSLDEPEDGPITQHEKAMLYLETNKLPEVFRSLLAGLMIETPKDHLTYMEQKVDEIKAVGINNINFESFLKNAHPHNDPIHKKLIVEEYGPQKKGLVPYPLDDERVVYESHLFKLTEMTSR